MTEKQDPKRDTKSPQNKRNDNLSPDGKWRSFPKVPNLLQYVSTELYYGRVKINGKLIRRSLETDVFSTAKLKLEDFKKAEREKLNAGTTRIGTVGAALKVYLRSLRAASDISPATKKYYTDCVRVLFRSWPKLGTLTLASLTMQKTDGEAFKADGAFQRCQAWAERLAREVTAQYFNNVLGRLRVILEIGGVPRHANPAWRIKRQGIEIVPPQLPTLEQFGKIVKAMETSGAGQQQECADLARFLAYSGCRIGEAREATWSCVDLDRGILTITRNKRRKGKVVVVTKTIPIIQEMRALLERIKPTPLDPNAKILGVGECEKSLRRACKLVGAPRLTHHDLRHLFATVCIESGIPIQTVSRWLGHSDGGALAMRIYGHLRDEHSLAMAQKVSFGHKEA